MAVSFGALLPDGALLRSVTEDGSEAGAAADRDVAFSVADAAYIVPVVRG